MILCISYLIICLTGTENRKKFMKKNPDKYETVPFPRARQPIVDALHQVKNKSIAHALIEMDITDARQQVKDYRKRAGQPLSFTAYLIYCLAQAVDENKLVHAYRRWGKLIIFDEVDIAVQIERDLEDEGKAPIYPHVIKAANHKTPGAIHAEISRAREEDAARIAKWTGRYWHLPGFIRGFLWRIWLGSPYWRKKLTGTVSVSTLGMFGTGAGWGIPVSTYTLSITAGGIAEKPKLINGQLETSQYLSVTVSFDHDVIDGAPAARFIQRFKELIESSHGLREG
jgi:pyruvate/2-oxoglutarate dehydrogenase complex dihydrolipoamide acyltransferase (E2) component